MSTNDARTISIQMKASAFSRADVGFVDLYVRADGMLLSDAVAEARQKTEKIVEGVRKTGEVTSVMVLDVQMGGSKHFGMQGSPKPEAVKNIVVTIPPSPELAVKIFDVAVRMGASLHPPQPHFNETPSGVLFGLLSSEETEASAMTKAIEDAKTSAQKAAKLIGKRVGSVVKVTNVATFSEFASTTMFGARRIPSRFPTQFLSASAERIEVGIAVTVDLELLD